MFLSITMSPTLYLRRLVLWAGGMRIKLLFENARRSVSLSRKTQKTSLEGMKC